MNRHHVWLFPLLLATSFSAQALKSRLLDLPVVTGAAQPAVASDRKGGFLLSWQRRDQGVASLYVARFDRDGAMRDVNTVARSATDQTWFVNWADFPSLVVLDNGDWLTFWLQKRSAATYAYDIHLTRSTDQGKHWQESVIVHRDGSASEHGFVSMLPAGKDQALVMWLDGRHTASKPDRDEHDHSAALAMSLRSALVDRAGVIRQESEIDARTCDCCSTDAARLGARSMVIYRDRSEEEIRDPAFSVRKRDGSWSTPALVHADGWKITGCPVNGPALASHGKSAIAIWSTMANEVLSVRTAFGNAKGFGRTHELESGTNVLGRVDATAWRNQQFLLSWIGSNPAADGSVSIKLAAVDRQLKLSTPHIIRSFPANTNMGFPRMASSGDRAMMVWTEVDEQSTRIRAALISDDDDATASGAH